MYLSDMEALFNPCMEQVLGASGFKFRKTWHQFIRTNSVGRDIIGFPRHKHGDYIHTSVSIGVRHEQIEELITDVLEERVTQDPESASWADRESLKDRRKWHNNATVGADLGNISMGQFKTWEILTEPDLARSCAEMIEMIHRYAEPYYTQFRTTEDFLGQLAPDDTTSWRLGGARHHRAIKAVAAAYLLHDRTVFDELCVAKETFLAERNDEYGLQQFKLFTAVLKRRWNTGATDTISAGRISVDQ